MNYEDPRSLRRLEDDRFLRGAAHYTDDTPAHTHLHAAFLRSPHAHAIIRTIDTTAAAALPGVHAILTAAHLDAANIRPLPSTTLPPDCALVVPPRHALATTQVRHVGEPVALIVAETQALARDAAEHIHVDYDPLPAITDPTQALAEDAPQLWPEAPGNLAFTFTRGNPTATAAAFATAATTVTVTLVNNRVVPAPLETRTAVARHDPANDRLHLLCSGQAVHALRRDIAHCFNLPEPMVHVACPDVGGGFGLKNVLHPEQVALLHAARHLARIVRWTPDRTEDFTAGAHARDNVTTARLALDADNRFTALEVHTIGNLGAYASATGPGPLTNSPSTAMGGVYDIPHIAMHARAAFTNTTPTDIYRGAGKPEANYLIERLIHVAAHQLGIDPAALRRLNLVRTFPYHSPYRTPLGLEIDTGQFVDNLDAAQIASDAQGFPARQAEAATRNRWLGRGLACFLETSRGQPTEDAAIRFLPGGTIELLTGTQSNGQGLETSFAQLAANRTGLPIAAFRLIQADTDRFPRGGGHGGARSLVMAGTALTLAIDAALARARPEAARLLQSDPARLHFTQGAFHTPEGATLTLAALTAALPPGTLDAEAHNPAEKFVFPNGCHVAEVEVDPETGATTLRRYTAVDDYGILLNPLLAEGQVQGGLAQGIGQALMERVHFDESGQLLTASFADYQIPRAADLPDLTIRFNEHPTARNPLGAKGSGQAGAMAAPQTIIAAIVDAIGIPHIDMPATPERVWRACQAIKTPR